MQRSGCLYSVEERKIISKWKTEYKAAPSKEVQAHLFKDKILPAIFNFWTKDGSEPIIGECMDVRVKTLARWIANNWQPDTKESRGVTIRTHITYIDIVCRDRMDAVLTKMMQLCDGECPEPGSVERFTLRTKAAKLAYDHMSADEKATIDKAVAEARQFGGDLSLWHRTAAKKGDKRVQQWSKKSWLEMDMFTLTYEDMAKNMGVTTSSFLVQYDDQITLMLRRLGEYIKSLQNLKNQSGIVPGIPDSSRRWIASVGKRKLVTLMREFLNAHYVLASGRKRKRVPFLTLEENASLFIEEEYLPASFAMKDPHNLRKEAMEAFFDLVQKRQMERGESDSFRFHAYEVEKGELVPAEYPETEQSISQMAGKRKQRGNVTEVVSSIAVRGNAPSMEADSGKRVPRRQKTLAVQEVADQSSVSHGGVGQGGEGRHSRRGPESNLSPDIEAFSGEEDGPGAATFMPDGLGTASTDIEAGLSTVPHQDLVVVNHDIACQLQRIGVSVGEPINGPMEGDPQYAVPPVHPRHESRTASSGSANNHSC
ncbi:hypothetical protein NP233_g9994 [Leucocoprinus birnbaumii]|uniref:Uncharacterized protein n=1 Tax=Leucocoprinus birnbaumii TaxID=56174 RepID=A0AAD5VJV6_9AGAR|nr:hypothetical protein NP233_g9994 [Leucocoprinus birnbaumii]